jgi:hypothetical protein
MILHPLLIAVMTLDGLALVFSSIAARTHLRVLLEWDEESCGARQIALEAATESASLAGRLVAWLFVAASVLLIVAISVVLPPTVVGAMCGTGVMAATKGLGERALLARAGAVLALWIWRTMDSVNREHPSSPATPRVARWHLLAVPMVAMAAWYNLRSIRQLDPYEPVDCCQAVYDNFRSIAEATSTFGVGDEVLGTWTLVGGLLIATAALGHLWRLRRGAGLLGGGLLAALVVVWVPLAGITLVRVLAAYHYGVLHHHCPWCLFLPTHGAVGFVLFGGLALVGIQGATVLAAGALGRQETRLARAARNHQMRALFWLLAGLIVFAAFGALPALAWRLRHGVWL